MRDICQDLADEYQSLDDLVSHLSDERWKQVTPFYGWTIQDEICHLAYFDATARLAVSDRKMFEMMFEEFLKRAESSDSMFDVINAEGKKMTTSRLLETWRDNRFFLVETLKNLDSKERLPWYGPDMSAKSFATARLMETWAHGQDVADALGVRREPTNRLKHIAFLGVNTLNWSFANRKMEAPTQLVRIELSSPSGERWAWGSEEATDTVRGSAEEFCLVVTQRRNMADTELVTEGETAFTWMKIAQAFAGPPEEGPQPGERVVEYGG